MKKTVKIVLVVVASVIVIGMAAIYLLRNYMLYRTAKMVIDNSAVPYSEYTYYDLGTIDKYKTVSFQGITADIPDDLDHPAEKEDDSDFAKEYKKRIYADENYGNPDAKYATRIIFLEEDTMAFDRSFDEIQKIGSKAHERFLRKMGKENIDNWYEFYDLLYSLDYRKVSIFSSNDCALLSIYSVYKAALATSSDRYIYRFENDTVCGYVKDWTNEERICFVADMCEKADPEKLHTVLISTPDEETAYKIINSIRINTGE